MNYGDLIVDAFRMALRNRYLWFFGLFAGGASLNFPPGGDTIPRDDPERSSEVSAALAAQGVFGNTLFTVGLVVVVVSIVLFFVAMSLVSQGALTENVAAMDRGEERRFRSGWRAGLGSFWRVLGYYVLFILIGLGLLAVIGAPIALLVWITFAVTQSAGVRLSVAILAGLVAVLLLIAVFVPLSIIMQYALREIVVRRERIVGSIGSGYGIFRRNLGRSLLVWLINLGLGIGVWIAFTIAFLLVGLVVFIPTVALVIAEQFTAAVVVGIATGLILLPILLAALGAVGTFFHSYWTLAYLRLTAPPAPVPPPDPYPL